MWIQSADLPEQQVSFKCQCMVQIYTPDKLNDLMASSDYVVAALPHTDKTEKLVNAEAINSMKETGVFVTIGRGQTVDEDALIKGGVSTVVNCSFQCLYCCMSLPCSDSGHE